MSSHEHVVEKGPSPIPWAAMRHDSRNHDEPVVGLAAGSLLGLLEGVGGRGVDAVGGIARVADAFVIRQGLPSERFAAADAAMVEGEEHHIVYSTVGVCVARRMVWWAGDLRAYRVGPLGLQQLTVDDTLVQKKLASGLLTPDDARRHPHREVLTNALGAGEGTLQEATLGPGALRILLSTPGLHHTVDLLALHGPLATWTLDRAMERVQQAAEEHTGIRCCMGLLLDVPPIAPK